MEGKCIYLLILFVDALRYDYIREDCSPFLFRFTREGFCARLKPILGYSLGITTSIWTGTYPRTHGNWLFWGYNKKVERQNLLFFKFFKIFPRGKLRILAKHLFWYLLIKIGSPAQAWFMPSIPDELLPFFTKLGNDFSPEISVSRVPTLFNILTGRHIEYAWRDAKSMRADKYDPIRPKKGTQNFVEIMFIPQFDRIGHDFGPFSSKIEREMSKLDSFVQKLVENYSTSVKDLHIVLLSDHGMAQVTRYVNIHSVVEKLPLRPIKDYLAFYDSTIARFWVFNRKTEENLVKALQNIPEVKILSQEELEKSGLAFKDNRYGDILFQVEVGVKIFPNYFRSVMPRWIRPGMGMHGYDGSDASQHGLFVYHGSLRNKLNFVDSVSVVDVMPTILDILGLPPSRCEGVSLLRSIRINDFLE